MAKKHTAENVAEFKFRCTKPQKAYLEKLPWGEASQRLRDAVEGMRTDKKK